MMQLVANAAGAPRRQAVSSTVHVELEVTDKKVTSDGRRAVLGRKLRLCKHDGSLAQEGLADLMVALEEA